MAENGPSKNRKVADVWKKDVWEFQAKSGSSGSRRLFLHFLGKIAVRKMSGRTPGTPRRPSCRHPRPSEKRPIKRSKMYGFSSQLLGIVSSDLRGDSAVKIGEDF